MVCKKKRGESGAGVSGQDHSHGDGSCPGSKAKGVVAQFASNIGLVRRLAQRIKAKRRGL